MMRGLKSWQVGLVMAAAISPYWLLVGCGGKSEEPAAGGEAGTTQAEMPPGAPGEPGAPGPPGAPGGPAAAPSAAPSMPAMPGAPAPGAAPAPPTMPGAPAGAVPTALRPKPRFKGKDNVFAALDKPSPVPPPPPPQPYNIAHILPVRAPVAPPSLEREQQGPSDTQLSDVRTAGFVWGSTVKAILQQGDRTILVRPGDTVPISTPGADSLTVEAISAEGVRLRNERTKRVYLAPFRRG
ncbi:MAG: hypothetical protein IT204_19735 [Fimbriimonadaceae bacterium]|nr:hypothetical protein [Fimbriimonadaceae bacterium]